MIQSLAVQSPPPVKSRLSCFFSPSMMSTNFLPKSPSADALVLYFPCQLWAEPSHLTAYISAFLRFNREGGVASTPLLHCPPDRENRDTLPPPFPLYCFASPGLYDQTPRSLNMVTSPLTYCNKDILHPPNFSACGFPSTLIICSC